MHIDQNVQKKITKEKRNLLNKIGAIYLSLLLLFLGGAFSLNYQNKKSLAETYSKAVRESLIIRDYRQAMTILKTGVDGPFVGIKYAAGSGEEIFSLSSAKSKMGPTLFLKYPMAFGSVAKDVPLLSFETSALAYLGEVVFSFILILLLSVPAMLKMVGRVTHDLHAEMKRKKVEEVWRMSRQVAHDIRSPLSAIRMAVHGIGECDGRTAVVKQACLRLQRIADDLLGNGLANEYELASEHKRAAEKPLTEVSSPKINKKPYDIVEIVGKLVAEKKQEYATDSLARITFYPEAVPSIIPPLSRGELERILSNLINNAVEALQEKGFVSVSVAWDGQNVLLAVRDSGPGIPKSLLGRICEEGFSYGKQKGNGLGLYYCRQRVEAVKGEVRIETEQGRGTTVVIQLPCQSINWPQKFIDHA